MPKDDGFERCHLCGCTEIEPCHDEDTGNAPCDWYDIGLCTACAHDPIDMVARLVELREWVERTLAEAGLRLKAVAKDAGIEKGQIARWLNAHGNFISYHDVDNAMYGTPEHVMHVAAVAIAIKALAESPANHT